MGRKTFISTKTFISMPFDSKNFYKYCKRSTKYDAIPDPDDIMVLYLFLRWDTFSSELRFQ